MPGTVLRTLQTIFTRTPRGRVIITPIFLIRKLRHRETELPKVTQEVLALGLEPRQFAAERSFLFIYHSTPALAHWPLLKDSKSSKYEPSSCELSKMWMSMACHQHQAWVKSQLALLSYCWRSLISTIFLLQSVSLLAYSLDTCPCMSAVLLAYCTFQGTVRLKVFYFLCLSFMYYLYEKYYKPMTMQYCKANYVTWVPRLMFWTYEQIRLANVLLEWNLFVCGRLPLLFNSITSLIFKMHVTGFFSKTLYITKRELCVFIQDPEFRIGSLRSPRALPVTITHILPYSRFASHLSLSVTSEPWAKDIRVLKLLCRTGHWVRMVRWVWGQDLPACRHRTGPSPSLAGLGLSQVPEPLGRDFPGGSVAKTPHSRRRGTGFDPCLGN